MDVRMGAEGVDAQFCAFICSFHFAAVFRQTRGGRGEVARGRVRASAAAGRWWGGREQTCNLSLLLQAPDMKAIKD